MNLVCVDCHQSLWIGQRSAGNSQPYLYTIPEHLEALNLFLVTHRDHLLSCILENDAFMRTIDGREVRISTEEFSPPQVSALASSPLWRHRD